MLAAVIIVGGWLVIAARHQAAAPDPVPAKAPDTQAELRVSSAPTAPEEDNSAFVTLTDVVPDAILEIRYFSTFNFVGERIDGYLEPTALLTKQAADSLRAVSDDLMARGYRLKIFDAYRPQRAVDHFRRWAADASDTRMKPYFYPDLPKSLLFKQGYISARSGHTRGSTVDLTLFDMNAERRWTWAAPSTGSVPKAIPLSAATRPAGSTRVTTARARRAAASPPSSSATA